MDKNAYRLTGSSKKKGYDWWWHSFVGKHADTGELKPFFIEYFVMNPGLWKGEIIYGQQERNKREGIKPCYAMIKAGTWGENKAQIHNFFPIDQYAASSKILNCKIGENTLNETALKGKVNVSREESNKYPERMSDAGSIEWNLKAIKQLSFDLGYGSGRLFNMAKAFHMYWHVAGMKTTYTGNVIFNGEKYNIEPATSFGYQDKNWGKDFTNPWIWLNCNNFRSKKTAQAVEASLVVGGGCPKVFGIPLNRQILTAFYYKGQKIEFNFAKFWKRSKQTFSTTEDETYFYWHIISENRTHRIKVDFKCEKRKMLWVNYESPAGKKEHHKLWNGGHAEGQLKFFRKGKKRFTLMDDLVGNFGGCEYGEY